MEISVAISTKDRPDELYQCICSILEQTTVPNEVIVIDDGNLSPEFIENIGNEVKSKRIAFHYIKKVVPGLSLSRNLGAAKSRSPIVLFLDDDVILDKDYIEILKQDWEKYQHEKWLGGIGGVIKNLRRISVLEKIFHKLFLLSSSTKWDVTDMGFQVWTIEVEKEEKVFYLPGGVTSFKKDLIEKIPFRQLSPGRTPSDDVEFFLKTKKQGYYFILDPRAKLFHKQAPVARENDFVRGGKEGYNQCIIFNDNVEKSALNYLKFSWSSIGWIMRQFLAGNFLKGMGMISGYIRMIMMKLKGKRY